MPAVLCRRSSPTVARAVSVTDPTKTTVTRYSMSTATPLCLMMSCRSISDMWANGSMLRMVTGRRWKADMLRRSSAGVVLEWCCVRGKRRFTVGVAAPLCSLPFGRQPGCRRRIGGGWTGQSGWPLPSVFEG